MDRRKGLKAGVKRLGPVNRFHFWGFIVIFVLSVLFFVIQMNTGATKKGQKVAQEDRDNKHLSAQLDRETKHKEEMTKLQSIDSKLVQEIEKTPDIAFESIGWRQIKTVSADCGIRAAFVINNGETLISNLCLLDEYYIRVENLPDMKNWLSDVSETFDREKEDALVFYHKKRLATCRKITQFIESEYSVDMDLANMRAFLDDCGIKAQIYGQEKEYYFEPIILRPNEKHPYEFGRSTGQPWLEDAILDKGTNMLIVVSVLEYQGNNDSSYRSFLISRSELGRNTHFRTPQGILYWPLVKFKEWQTEVE